MSKFLITGGAGFIGGNFCRYMVNKYPSDEFVCLDALTYAGNLEVLKTILDKPNFKFIYENICNQQIIFEIFEKEHFDYVVNFAAESDVDRSIVDSSVFFQTNVIGTRVLLDACRKFGIKRFHQVSTDEVYGSLSSINDKPFLETSLLCPSNPYSASKAAADLLVISYYKTHNLECTISRSSNNYGPYQHLEKLIPLMISKALQDDKLPVYGDGKNIRDWIYVDDHCQAIELIIKKGKTGEIYNVGCNQEKPNIEIVKMILAKLNKKEDLIEYVEDRKGHDWRYAINTNKITKDLGWQPKYSFESAIEKTINWYLNQ